jgi:hypothetical protein
MKSNWVEELFVKEFILRDKLLPADFYYDELGRRVMTSTYHIRRGTCCGNGCKHCPYEPAHEKGNTTLKDIY